MALTRSTRELAACDALVVPGVGAYAACMTGLRASGGTELLADWLPTGKPLLGICVGHQIFFESGSEHGVQATGLGIWPGRVQLLAARRLPHMGWNRVEVPDGSRIFASVETERFYFVHSYAAPVLPVPPQPGTLVTTATHETTFIAAVESAGICSTQFHPEKSGGRRSAAAAQLAGAVSSVGLTGP